MSQNRSPAVMAQRAEPDDSLDFFPTPPWATRALFEHVIHPSGLGWDPACGMGDMVKAMDDYMLTAASDVHDYGCGYAVHDFLMPWTPGEIAPDWVITNPPFRLGEQFIKRALTVATVGTAMLVRSVFIESASRYEGLFRDNPPEIMAQFVERVPMVKGRLDRAASTATSYCWLVWLRHQSKPRAPTRLQWIPPCRAKLDRDADWPVAA